MKSSLHLAVVVFVAIASSAIGQTISPPPSTGGGGTPGGNTNDVQCNAGGTFGPCGTVASTTNNNIPGQRLWLRDLGTGLVGNSNSGELQVIKNDGSDGNIITGNLTLSALATDATHTDNTVCVDSSSGVFYKGSGTLGVCLGTSSARYKHDITPLGSSLAEIVALKPSQFYYNKGHGDDGARLQYGFIAEDVAKVIPGIVALDDNGKPNSVDMLAMVPMLVKAMQEQQATINCLRQNKSGC